MQYKIALQLSGQLRNWNTSVKYWNNLISILENVDVYTCFWNEDYARQQDISKINNLVLNNLIEPPRHHGYSEWSKEYQHQWPYEFRKYQLYPQNYLIFKGGYHRRLYQLNNNIDYDAIIVSRPDFNLQECKIRERSLFTDTSKFISDVVANKYSAFLQGVRNLVGESGYHKFSNDYFFIGTEESMNLLTTNILSNYIDKGSFHIGEHNAHILACTSTGLLIKELSLQGTIIREEE